MATAKEELVRARCLAAAAEGLAARDWRAVYEAEKGWRGWGAGSLSPGAWLLSVVNGLLLGQPKQGVHGADLALRQWLEQPADRAILLWARGEVLRLWAKDPRTALADLEAAQLDAPPWLLPRVEAALEACRTAAATSRRRKPVVGPPPPYSPLRDSDHLDALRARADRPDPGAEPELWDAVVAIIEAGPPPRG